MIGQHENGRYSKAHRHGSSAILICAKGKGYASASAGTARHDAMEGWSRRQGDSSGLRGGRHGLRRSHERGLVRQHFGTGSGPLRLTAWFGPNNHDGMKPGVPGEQLGDIWAWDVDKGGKAIPYRLEDPFIRAEYEAELAKYGAKSRMEDQLYNPNS